LPVGAPVIDTVTEFRNSVGRVIWIEPSPIVLEAVHGDTTGKAQFVTCTVHVPESPLIPVVGSMVATNCFTRAGAAPLRLGAATRAAIRSKALATKTSLPRLESNGLNTDMSCPFFLAGHTTRITLLPSKLARELQTNMTSQRSPLNGVKGG
jgi:hypothetical protein